MKDIILHGDVYACLNEINNNSIAVVITSPPYWQQRDYGFKDQIGQEETSQEYIGHLKEIFSKLKVKLRDDGIFFLNIGDKYLSQYGKSNLLLIPYRLAFHMVKDGWILEDIIIWYKPNHMPSSVKDRFTNTYEPVFVFSKNYNNIYRKQNKSILKINLQQTKWKHTAVFPEKLIEELLNKVVLKDGDKILDPFAGTGTVAVVVKKKRMELFGKKIFCIMIDKGQEFIDIIKKKTGIKSIKKINDFEYKWEFVKEERLSFNKYYIPYTKVYGEVYIGENSEEFISLLKGIKLNEFKDFYREDAVFFYGVKDWSLSDFYYFSRICDLGYVVRNIIIVSNNETWFPMFMFVNDNTRYSYKFYLDRVRIDVKTEENFDWNDFNFYGMLVRDITGKKSKEGMLIKILKRYNDGFPKFVEVRWNGTKSIDYVLHSDNDDLIREGLNFKCNNCEEVLIESFDLISENVCPSCKTTLWENIKSIPNIEEPKDVIRSFIELENIDTSYDEIYTIELMTKQESGKNSKFKDLDRINWGQSPGARKVMLGEYFTKMRLYRLEHPLVAQYLKLMKDSREMSIKKVTEAFPKSYKHTVGHWFRTDFGGSIPIPKDIERLQEIFNIKDDLLSALKRTALKLQIVKASIKGRNPGDYIEGLNDLEVVTYLNKLFLPSQEYIKLLKQK